MARADFLTSLILLALGVYMAVEGLRMPGAGVDPLEVLTVQGFVDPVPVPSVFCGRQAWVLSQCRQGLDGPAVADWDLNSELGKADRNVGVI